MSRQVANVDIITDSFEIWLLETNELLHALSTEIMTANATYANTGNSTFNRTAQLYGTFGSNNLVVTDWVKGGNVNGQFANLMVSTNTYLSNTNAANLNLMVANGSTFSYVNPYGGYFGNTTANSLINSTAIITQSNSIVNTNIRPTLVQVANSITTANMTAGSFKTGIFQANTIEMQVGSNVIANATSLYLGNSTINSVHTQAQSTLANSIHSTLITQEKVLIGNSTINALANSTLITIANSISSANVDPISFKTGIFTGNTTAMSVGANLIANSTSLYVGNATINTIVTQTTTTISNGSQSATLGVATASLGNTSVLVGGNNVIWYVTDALSTANITSTAFKTGIFTGNTTAMSVGANLIANSTSLYLGNSIVNTVLTQTTTTISNATHNATLGIAAASFGNSTSNTILSQSLIRASNATVSSNVSTTGFITGIFTANQSVMSVGANVYANATSLYVGNSTASITYGNNIIVGSANIGISATSYLNITGGLTVSSNTALSNTLTVTGNTNLSNTLTVTGATSLSNTLAVTGTTSLGGVTTIQTDYVIEVTSNTNLGVTTGSSILAYRFPLATYSSAKITAQVKNTGNTQISEMVLAHDGTTAYVTVFGTVASPGFANNNVNPLATFSANVNGANVDLLINQSVANSAAKFIAHLIK